MLAISGVCNALQDALASRRACDPFRTPASSLRAQVKAAPRTRGVEEAAASKPLFVPDGSPESSSRGFLLENTRSIRVLHLPVSYSNAACLTVCAAAYFSKDLFVQETAFSVRPVYSGERDLAGEPRLMRPLRKRTFAISTGKRRRAPLLPWGWARVR